MTDPLLALGVAKALAIGFLGGWLALAAWNNLIDSGTNRHLLGEMIPMTQLKEDPVLGKGLVHRAIMLPTATKIILGFIAAYQFFVVVLLLRAGYLLWPGTAEPAFALAQADWALLAFGALWGFFLIGGLWFGYWMKRPQVQQVHLTALVVTYLSFILLHSRP